MSMVKRCLRGLACLCLLALPAIVSAQEAAVSGVVTDSSGAVLPGATITALHQATGNIFEVVTDEKGAFRMPVRTGDYTVKAELSGFAAASRSLTLLPAEKATASPDISPAIRFIAGDPMKPATKVVAGAA